MTSMRLEPSRWANLFEWFEKGRVARWASNLPRAFRHRRRSIEVARLKNAGCVEFREAELFWGRSMMVTVPEAVSSELYCRGYFEEGLTRALLDLLKPGMTFIDVGAHFGYFSMLAADLVGSDGAVRSLEPTPATYETLTRNLRHWPYAQAVPQAAYSSSGKLKLKIFPSEWSAFNSLGSPRVPALLGQDPVIVEVSSVTLDEFVATSELNPDFVKIDAESTESEVLDGMSQIMARTAPYISIEVGDEGGSVGRSRALIDRLVTRGYRAFVYENRRFVKHEPKLEYHYDNLIMIPDGRPVGALFGS